MRWRAWCRRRAFGLALTVDLDARGVFTQVGPWYVCVTWDAPGVDDDGFIDAYGAGGML